VLASIAGDASAQLNHRIPDLLSQTLSSWPSVPEAARDQSAAAASSATFAIRCIFVSEEFMHWLGKLARSSGSRFIRAFEAAGNCFTALGRSRRTLPLVVSGAAAERNTQRRRRKSDYNCADTGGS